MRWKKQLASALLTVSLVSAPLATVHAEVDQDNLETLDDVYKILADQHYSHPDQDALLKGAIDGMLKVLNDPFTQYMTPQEYQDFVSAIQQQYAGVGTVLSYTEDDQLLITSVYAGTPAEQAGLQAGDLILAVNGEAITTDNLEQAASKIRGEAGTDVVLTIKRGKADAEDYTVTRRQIDLPTVESMDLGDGYGYLRIYSFAERTGDEFISHLNELEANGDRNGLVIDLRGNGGGFVMSALTIADHLLKKGTILMLPEGDVKQEIAADEAGDDIPVVVLVDQNSASASEILAGALQKNDRAKLIGTVTYGKGTMQQPTELPNGGTIKTSIVRYEFGDGTSPDKVGLTPDVPITHPDFALNAALHAFHPDSLQTLTLSRQVGGSATLNESLLLDAPAPLTAEGQVYLPLRYLVEAFGHEVRWLPTEAVAVFELGGHTVRIETRALTVTIDGQAVSDAHAVKMVDGSTYLSTAALTQITGQDVTVTDQDVTVQAR